MRARRSRRRVVAGIAAAAALSGAGTVLAQPAGADAPFPARPIRIVVPFPPGGSSDAMIRIVARELGRRLEATVVTDNKPGAGANVGMTIVAHAPPDGYTLGVAPAGAMSVNSALYPTMPFDPAKDFEPISMLAMIPFVLVGHTGLAAADAPALLRQARAATEPLSVGHGGNGTAMHLAGALLAQEAALKLNFVAYRGSGPAAQDVIGAQVALAVVDLTSALPFVQAGRLRAYAVTSAERVGPLPDVPTLAEAGVKGFEAIGWLGLVAPAGTPAAIVERLNREINAALTDPRVRAEIEATGVSPAPGTRQAFGAFIASETAKWARVVRTAGIKLQ